MRLSFALEFARRLAQIGPRRVLLHLRHRSRLRSGWYLRRTPTLGWADVGVWLGESPFPAPDLERVRAAMGDGREAAIAEGERLLGGEVQYFSDRWFPLPTDWRSRPGEFEPAPDAHWTLIDEECPERGDVKWFWEPARFDWTYRLARAWAASGDERFVEGFWALLASWRDACPPNRGIQWRCGQECAYRLLALVWAAGAFQQCRASSAVRVADLWQTVAALAQRIEATHDYARAQANNHALSEAAALYVAGASLHSHPRAARWRTLGRRSFLDSVQEQFAPDGGHTLHSVNYLRVCLRDAFAFLCVAEVAPPERLIAATRLLRYLIDPEIGRAPNYGLNDGSNVADLSGCGFDDFRPVVQTMSALFGEAAYTPGPYDEELAWYGLPLREVTPATYVPGASGYRVFVGDGTRAFVRCHAYRNRPFQCDLLHVDLWSGGVPLTQDGGTFEYADDKGVNAALDGAAGHNAIVVDGQDPMRRAGRFFLLDWQQASELEHVSGCETQWVGETWPAPGVRHRRSLLGAGDAWLVVDDVFLAAPVERELAVHWRLGPEGDAPLFAAANGPMARGVEAGWIAPRYGRAERADVLVLRAQTRGPFRFVTSFGAALDSDDGGVVWCGRRVSLVPGGPL